MMISSRMKSSIYPNGCDIPVGAICAYGTRIRDLIVGTGPPGRSVAEKLWR